uniref:Long-chain-fatty-acid--CoA ligase n=1 Tax=Arion vulgaris TaxID=1028688 RepID=A0A0B7ANZ2_9EUPU
MISKLQQLAVDNSAPLAAVAVAGIVTASYIMSTRSNDQPLPTPFDLNDQSVTIDGKPEHRASKLSKPPDYYERDVPVNEVKTVYGALERGRIRSENGPCLGARTGPNKEFVWYSYQEVIDKTLQFGSGLINSGVVPGNKTCVGIYATNRPEWAIADYGCQAYSMCPVPLYDTLGLQAIKYILDQCEITTVVCDTETKVRTLIELKNEFPLLKLVVLTEALTEELKLTALNVDLSLITFEELLLIGKENAQDPVPPKPDDIYSICYTSGTTGNPKGVVLTQFAFQSMVQSLLVAVQINFVPTPDDVHLSYLPLAHNFERACHVMLFLAGGRIGYFSRDIKLLTDDLVTLKPTIFPTVPRLLNRIYDAVHGEVKGSKIKSALLRWALASKQKDVDRRIYRRDSVWDKILFKKVQNKLGGRVRIVITGSAPISPDVVTFLRCALGCLVVEGYGQTEAGAGVTITVPGDPSVGNVGPPFPGCHIKLVDVPEMNYYAKDNFGEICAKADFLFREYYKDPEKTAETLDSEGWLHTGDVGTWLPNGTLKVVDRKKNIFKLAQGEYVATEKIENVYQNSSFIAQIFVDGDSLQTCLMAVVVPDVLYLEKWARNAGFPSNIEDFCRHKDAKDTILKDLLAQGKKAKLQSFEQVKDIYLETEMFTVENDLLTPTLKNKRPALRNKYKNIITELYAKNVQ